MAKPSLTMRIEGLEEVDRALADLGQRLGKATLERALRKAAKPMLDAAKQNAPVDEGDLKQSLAISNRLKKAEAGRAAYARTMKATGGNKSSALSAMRDARRNSGEATAQLYLGPKVGKGGASHGHLVEYGTGPRFTKDGRYTGEMPPRPFLRPAFDAQAGPTVDRLKPILAKEIAKTKARAAKRQAKKG